MTTWDYEPKDAPDLTLDVGFATGLIAPPAYSEQIISPGVTWDYDPDKNNATYTYPAKN